MAPPISRRAACVTNLELASEFRLTREGGPILVFEDLLKYVKECSRCEIADQADKSVRGIDRFCGALGSFIATVPQKTRRGSLHTKIIHNYEKPLFDQAFSWSDVRTIEEMVVVSPFFDPEELVKEDDPDEETLEDDLLERLASTLSPKRIRFMVQLTDDLKTSLPVKSLARLGKHVEVYDKNHTSEDSRRLHAKLVLLSGATAAGKTFVSIIRGSANFTSAAYLSTANKGNSELIVRTDLIGSNVTLAQVEEVLQFGQLFEKIPKWKELKCRVVKAQFPRASMRVLDAILSVSSRSLSICVRVANGWRGSVRVALSSPESQERLQLGQVAVKGEDSAIWLQIAVGDRILAESTDDIGGRKLSYTTIEVEFLDEQGQVIESCALALNVENPEDFIRTTFFPEETSLDFLVYREGLGSTKIGDYERRVSQVERSPKTSLSPAMPGNQASLDQFFRNMSIGTRGLRNRLTKKDVPAWEIMDVLRRLGELTRKALATLDERSQEETIFFLEQTSSLLEHSIGVMKRKGYLEGSKAEMQVLLDDPLDEVKAYLRKRAEQEVDLQTVVNDLVHRLRSFSSQIR